MAELRFVSAAQCLTLILHGISSCCGEIGKNSHLVRPNIVLFLADDLGYGDVGYHGNENVSTPNIDNLAQQGLVFTRMYSQRACTPTRGSILTGRYPVRYGLVSEPDAFHPFQRFPVFSSTAQPGGLPKSEEPFLSSLLKTHGYRQAMIGKWHLGVGQDGKHLPMNYGFDRFYGVPCSHHAGCTTNAKYRLTDHDIFVHIVRQMLPILSLISALLCTAWYIKLLNRTIVVVLCLTLCGGLLLNRLYLSILLFNPNSCILMSNYDIIEQPYKEDNMTLRLTREALEFTSAVASDDQPFFLFMSHLQPHLSPYSSVYFKNKSGLGPYYDSVMELDWSVGVIVKQLKTLGVYNNTITIFASDNGPELTNPITLESNSPETLGSTMFVRDDKRTVQLRGEKTTLWEGGIRVPALISWPGNIQPGQKTDAVTDLMDIFPTIRDILQDTNTHKKMDGKSFIPLLANPKADSAHDFLMHYCHANVSAVTYGDYKVHFSTCDGVTFDIPQLYNVVKDPGETNPLPLSEYKDLMVAVISAVNEHHSTISPFPSQMSQLARPWLYLCANFPYCQKSLDEEEDFDDLINS